jgi:hypothetical protein
MRERKLTDLQVAEIRALGKTSMKKVVIARQYGISPQLVSTVIRHDYNNRPKRQRGVPVKDEDSVTWEALARRYTLLNPEDPLDGQSIKRYHDMALARILIYFEAQGLTKDDLI